MNAGRPDVFTVGHSNHTLDDFVGLLRRHGVTAVADVRSAPYSRFRPHFNKASLEGSLRERGIDYVFLGRELGGRTTDPELLDNGRVSYARVAATGVFRDGLRRVIAGAEAHRIALMCAEREPLACHRTLLVSRELERAGVRVAHIHPDGRVESFREAAVRLASELGLHPDLLRSVDEVIDDAFARQEQRVSFRPAPVGRKP